MHIYQKIRVHKYPNRIVLVRPHLPDMYPDKSTLFQLSMRTIKKLEPAINISGICVC